MTSYKKYAEVILSRIYKNGVTSDQITLISEVDDHRVLIHCNVLMASSKHFAATLGPDSNENDKTAFVLEETDGAMLKAIVDYCYTGLIDLTEENVFKFMAISNSFDFDLLNKKCRNFVHNKMTRSNALAIWNTAVEYNYNELREKAVALIARSFGERPVSEINGMDWRLLQAILKNVVNQVTQETVFKRLMDWFRHNEVERERHMTELLKLIRLKLLPPQLLTDEQVEAIFKRFNCYEMILSERRSRESMRTEGSNDDRSQYRSIYSLCKVNDYVQKDERIYVERYNNVSNKFEDVRTLDVRGRGLYGVQLHENKLYVIGGMNYATFLKSSKMSRFDLVSGKEEVLPEMNEARGTCTSILLGKYIYVFGGEGNYAPEASYDSDALDDGLPAECEPTDYDPGYLKSCERFDLETMTWTVLKPMNNGRLGAHAIASNGYIYVAGGIDRVLSPELYDPKNDEWHLLPKTNEYISTLFTSNSFVYACGYASMMKMHKYDVSKSCWNQEESFSQYLASAVETADGIFVITLDGDFGKISSDANNVWSFELLTKPRHHHYKRNSLLFLD